MPKQAAAHAARTAPFCSPASNVEVCVCVRASARAIASAGACIAHALVEKV